MHEGEPQTFCRLALQGLAQYGNGFLAKFEAASCPNRLLEEITLVDTPGVLSGKTALQPHFPAVCPATSAAPVQLNCCLIVKVLLHTCGRVSAAVRRALPYALLFLLPLVFCAIS